MARVFAIIIVACFSSTSFAFDHSHKNWSEVLRKYQNTKGLVQYKKLKEDISKDEHHAFNSYLTEIQGVKHAEFEKWTKNEKMAFLINSYNALTFKLILNNYPVASIKKTGGLFTKPWSVEFFSLLGGKIKSLDPIEHEWLRPVHKDYRIHAAVNCASMSCPPLRHEAFIAAKLDAQLDDQMKAWLEDTARNQISSKTKLFKLSKIFDWYKKDFEEWGGGAVNVISKHMTKPLPREIASQIKIEYLDYNWDLNEAK